MISPGAESSTASSPHFVHARPGQSLLQSNPFEAVSSLRESGAVLLRGFSSSLSEFQQFTEELCADFHQVGTRRAVDDTHSDGHTSEVPLKNFNLFAHSEGTYRPFPSPPELCFFNCVQAPSGRGGETFLVDGVRFLERLPANLLQRFEQQGILYEALWDKQRWQTEFQVDTLEQLDDLFLDHPRCRYQAEDEFIRVSCQVLAIQRTLGGLSAFANGLLAHLPDIPHPRWQSRNAYSKPTNRVFFGDGEEIGTAIINQLVDVQDEIALDHWWQANDVLILDNKRTMHGRRMTETGSERRIRSRFGRLQDRFR